MIKLIVSDMDGTFLNNQGTFDKALFKQAQQLMKQQNISFSPCTGKQCERVEELFDGNANDFWILGDSATRIKHNKTFTHEFLLNNSLALSIIDKVHTISSSQVVIACTKEGAFIKDNVPQAEYDIVRDSYAKLTQIHDFNMLTDDFIKITLYDPLFKHEETLTKLASFADQAHIVMSQPPWIDITAFNIHKGTTVKLLQKHLNVTAEETMVFGDGLNDIELMSCGMYSFAVSNAHQSVKNAANFITRSNDEDAVLHTIIRLLSLQQQ